MPARELRGTVVSNRGHKTAVVLVERRVLHPVQKKFIRRSKRYHVHDEKNVCQMGDQVRIREVPPISKLKAWILVERKEASAKAELTLARAQYANKSNVSKKAKKASKKKSAKKTDKKPASTGAKQ